MKRRKQQHVNSDSPPMTGSTSSSAATTASTSRRSEDRSKRLKKENDNNNTSTTTTRTTRTGLMSPLGVKLFKMSLLLLIMLIGIKFMYHNALQRDPVNIPFADPLPLTFSNNKWGSLRSTAYFGLKSMSANSIVTGMMWFPNRLEPGNNLAIRHWCSQFDGLTSYGWKKHDFDTFGTQEIVDRDLKIRTSFLIDEHQDDVWSARITVTSANSSNPVDYPVSLIFYASSEDKEWRNGQQNVMMTVGEREFPYPKDAPFIIKGKTKDLPNGFTLSMNVEEGSDENVLIKSYGTFKSEPPLVYLKEHVMQRLVVMQSQSGADKLIVLREEDDADDVREANFIAHQVVFKGNLVLRIDFTASNHTMISNYDETLSQKEVKFSSEFESLFHLKAKGYTDSEVSFAEYVAANLIGGIGFFSGSAKVSSGKSSLSPEDHFVHYGPFNLLTAVPSRSFFPRGFLWDEGFHHLVISHLHPQLSKQILRSWISLMNSEGWIPREVILGAEAEARVPAEFIVQQNANANPPTLFLTIESMMQRNLFSSHELHHLFPRLKLWFNWFNVTQVGSSKVGSTYRWRGRNASAVNELNPKTLTSGLDDYPRASDPSDSEYHVDLRSWMALASRVMAKIAASVDQLSDAERFQETADALSDNNVLDQLHWSDQYSMYCDFGMHSQNVKLVKKRRKDGNIYFTRTAVDAAVFSCVSDFGYVSLFPLLMQILQPDNQRLGLTIDRISDELLTPYGLRSLSRKGFYYMKKNTENDAPYWRGAIWININFLAIKSLKHYSQIDGPFRLKAESLYHKLRQAVVTNMIQEYQRSGYIWEQYDDMTGRGKGSHPFTGWSSLVLLIMSEEF